MHYPIFHYILIELFKNYAIIHIRFLLFLSILLFDYTTRLFRLRFNYATSLFRLFRLRFVYTTSLFRLFRLRFNYTTSLFRLFKLRFNYTTSLFKLSILLFFL